MKTTKKFLGSIISIILLIFIFFSNLIIFFKNTVVNEDYYLNIIQKDNIYDNVYEDINEGVKELLIRNNINTSNLSEVISKDEVKEEMNNKINNLFYYLKGINNDIPNDDLSKYADRVNAFLNDYINENNIERTDKIDIALEEVNSGTTTIISRNIDLFLSNLLTKSQKFNIIRKGVTTINKPVVLYGILIVDILLISILFMIFRSIINKAFSYIGKSFIISGLLINLIFSGGYLTRNYKNVPIGPQYIKEFIGNIIDGYFVNIFLLGAISVALGLVLMTVHWILDYNNQKNKKFN